MKRLNTYLQLISLICSIGNAYGKTIKVPTKQPTVQAGIDAAVAGDTVRVAAGTYNEDITLKSGVIVQGAGADKTTIQGTGGGSAVTAIGVDAKAKIDGFTITGGNGDSGGGIYCHDSSPTISNNLITGNSANNADRGSIGRGGGIFCSGNSSPIINGNVISENRTSHMGGGVFCNDDSSLTISDNLIMGNVAGEGGAIYSGLCSPMIFGNLITENRASRGGGISSVRSPITVTNNVIMRNRTNGDGGGICLFGFSEPTVSDNVIAENSAGRGGGIYCQSLSPTLTDNVITENDADEGGGIYCRYSSPTIADNTLRGNIAESGGGILCSTDSSPRITDNVIAESLSGSGIYCHDSSPVITGNVIMRNSSNGELTMNSSSGGGICCSGYSFPPISGNVIAENSARSLGGGIFCNEKSVPTISDNMIMGNSAGVGGAVFSFLSSPTITQNIIEGNSSASWGGGIAGRGSSSNVSRNMIIGNSAGDSGGGIGFGAPPSRPTVVNNVIAGNRSRNGGGISCGLSTPRITNNVIVGNSATGVGGGIYRADTGTYPFRPTITNCIIWGNGDDLYDCRATYSCIEDGDAGEGNISLDPVFVDAAKDDYRLRALSPCIDAGRNLSYLPSTDLLGNLRIVDGDKDGTPTVDMGAYEYVPVITVAIDVKPGNPINPINLRSRGIIKVALLTTDDFDAWAADVSTVTFGPDGASPVHITSDDVDGDGDLDVVFHFRQPETGIGPDDVTATLNGITIDSIPFTGDDAITVVPKGKRG